MAVILNTVSEIGDILIIRVSTPILGLLYLSDFTDTVVGETASKYFTKTFRYSVDGGSTYSDWLELTNDNIEGIEVEPVNPFLVEILYERSGTDTTGLIEFDDVTLNGVYEALSEPDLYSKSIFAQFVDFWGLCVLNWSLNVLEKLYRGIVPKYVDRGSTDNVNWEDHDFLDFFRSITHYFAIFVCWVRNFENLESNDTLLTKYLASRDLYTCGDEDLTDLIYLMNNFFDEIRQRGTMQIAMEKESSTDESSSVSDSSSLVEEYIKQVDGELLRLICKQSTDEFIFCPFRTGWFLDSVSPLYRGTNFAYNAIKGWELSQNFMDLSKYPLVNSQYCSIITDGSWDVLSIAGVPNSTQSGIQASDNTYGIVVSPYMNYEITFWVKQTVLEQVLDFYCKAYDQNGNEINLENIINGASDTSFFYHEQLNQADQWYFVRGILYNKDESLISGDQLDIGFGNNLRLVEDVVYIVPEFYVNNNTGGDYSSVYIYDFKIRPLNFDNSIVFLGLQNLIITWMKNSSGAYSDDQVTEIMRKKLIPYNSALINYFIDG